MLANYIIAHARAVASRALGTVKAVLVDLEGLLGDSSNDAPFFGTLGVVARPKPPVAEGSGTPTNPAGECEVLCIKNEDDLQPIACRDLRINARTNPAEGEIMLAGYDGGFLSIKPASNGLGSQLVLLAPALNSGTGAIENSHGLVMDPGTQNAVTLVHRSGHGLLLTSAGDAILKNADGSVYAQASGSALTLNGNIQVVGGMVVSPGTPTPQAVMLATNTLAWVAQVNVYLAALTSAITGLGGAVVGTPPAVTPIASTKLSAAP